MTRGETKAHNEVSFIVISYCRCDEHVLRIDHLETLQPLGEAVKRGTLHVQDLGKNFASRQVLYGRHESP